MLLLIDAGNTNIVFAVCRGGEILHTWRCVTDARRTADEYAAWLHVLFARAGLDAKHVTDVVLSSVVPGANHHLIKCCEDSFGREPLIINHESVDMRIRLAKPAEIGADRLVNALAAREYYAKPAIVIDFGTATTFDVVNVDGEYCGGAIAPGINLSASALYEAAAKLPRVDIAMPANVIGTDTVSAMKSGLYWGYVSMVEGMIARISAEMGAKPVIIATGGLSVMIAGGVPAIEHVDADLTLRGMMLIHARAAKRKAA